VFSALRVFEAFSFSDFQQTDLSKIDHMFLGILDLLLGLMEQRVMWVRLSSYVYFVDRIASIKCRSNKHLVISILSHRSDAIKMKVQWRSNGGRLRYLTLERKGKETAELSLLRLTSLASQPNAT
jgi:hypothetical protein